MITKEELLAKANKPSEDAMKLHPFYKGKYQIAPKCTIRDFNDFAIWYSPGVAAPCKDIHTNPEKVYEHTGKGNLVAVISDGTRVLGLGDIGPKAALPVMEGKALLFKYLGGVDAVPLTLDTKDPDKFIETVKLLEPAFGGINLEDIAQPKCFRILDTLRAEMNIPVWHDDQQGTATVILAGILNSLKLVNKELSKARIVLIGIGAANVATYRLLKASGATPSNIIALDSKGTLHLKRHDIEQDQENFPDKWIICQESNADQIVGDVETALKGADIFIAASKPGPGSILPEWIKGMNKDAIAFPCANPIPEIWPWEAKEAGAAIVGTGRSDFPNQINNSIGFPGIFRGVLDIRATTITDEMAVAAANEIAKVAEERGISPEYVVPTMDDWEVFPRTAVATAMKAQEQKLTLLTKTPEELYKEAAAIIKKSRDMASLLMKEGIIEPAPAE
ncbi:MAG: NADP-dependent malic enzyme [bacterium]